MYCGHCGYEVPDKLNYCTNCGQSLMEQRAQSKPPQKYVQTPIEVTIEKPGFKTTYHQVTPQPLQYSGCAIASLVLGLTSIGSSFLPVVNTIAFVMAIVGFILAIVGAYGIGKKRKKGNGFAIAGALLCIATIMIALITQPIYYSKIESAINDLQHGVKPAQTTNGSKAPKDYSKMKIGQSVALENGLTVTVLDAQKVQQPYTDKEQMRVTVSYINNGDKSVSYNLLDWKSENAQGVERSIEIPIGDDNSLDSGKLKPGGSITGNVYFENDIKKVYYYSNMLTQSESDICWVIK